MVIGGRIIGGTKVEEGFVLCMVCLEVEGSRLVGNRILGVEELGGMSGTGRLRITH